MYSTGNVFTSPKSENAGDLTYGSTKPTLMRCWTWIQYRMAILLQSWTILFIPFMTVLLVRGLWDILCQSWNMNVNCCPGYWLPQRGSYLYWVNSQGIQMGCMVLLVITRLPAGCRFFLGVFPNCPCWTHVTMSSILLQSDAFNTNRGR